MPRRRPPGEGLVVNSFLRFAALLFLPWLVVAQQQHRPAVRQQQESPLEGLEPEALHTLEATRLPPQIEKPRRSTYTNVIDIKKNDASAIATLAPAEKSAVAAPPARLPSSTAGLTSPQIARSLEDWEVEDFVLLATVDGKLHAMDRKTGKEKWVIIPDQPMVETKYHRKNRSFSDSVEANYDPMSTDDYLWIVEPSRDGSLYIYRPNGPRPGLVNTDLTMKKLVEEMCPYGLEDPPVMYTGEKKTSMITVDAHTGELLQHFGPTGSHVATDCPASLGLDEGERECPKVSTLTIGRTEYTVGIQGRRDGHMIATLKFMEWSPNNFDHDLQRQYRTTLDNKYIYTTHDGGVIGFDHNRKRNDGPESLFKHKFSTPVVRVFDVARAWGTEKSEAELIILPQPMPPIDDDFSSAKHRASNIFLNHTEDGSWYAMSGKSYPMAVEGLMKSSRRAQANDQGWLDHHLHNDFMNDPHLSEALVGLHSIENTDRMLTISGPLLDDNESETAVSPVDDWAPALMGDRTMGEAFRQLPTMVAEYILQLFKNPIMIIILFSVLLNYQRQIRATIGRLGHEKPLDIIVEPRPEKVVEAVLEGDRLQPIPENDVIEIPAPDESSEVTTIDIKKDEPLKIEIALKENGTTAKSGAIIEEVAPTPEKKKAHRGRRGGQKHKKGPERKRANSQEPSQDSNPHKAPPTIEDAVRDAKNMGQQTKLEPDIHTIPSDPQEVSGPMIRIGALEVNTDKLIGTGSNGTMVFEGNFDGRAVAVKRMLIQFFDIASQETKLLRESDDHPNVIRYFAQQSAGGFLYIALELCPASLADVIDKPQKHLALAQAGERDLPNVLYQITNGLRHLHNLRIVHRDLKPQNILVAMGKNQQPRLLVSDFGLCKKLEGEQSSFRATTAHAAGTSGWRAPELLLDDDAKDGLQAMVDASTDGNSGSVVLNPDLLPNRRATRAIDIFSLGLVFFYVLTKGSHPFDCGDKFMREVNIRKGTLDLKLLDVLGDYSEEAKNLIGSMLEQNPKERPQAHQVMAHPFFWSAKKRLNFLCDVSDHFEKEKRDPPTVQLMELESLAHDVTHGDFLKPLGKEFVESMGKQRKYTGTKVLDLLRALRNKKNHYEDMSDKLKEHVGALPEGYLSFWTRRFPNLLIYCWDVVYSLGWDGEDRFREYYLPGNE